jgi:hypothetical protein
MTRLAQALDIVGADLGRFARQLLAVGEQRFGAASSPAARQSRLTFAAVCSSTSARRS